MVNYDFCKKIEDDSKLAVLFNRAMKEIRVLRMTCAPRTFKDMQEQRSRFSARFYETCLWEMWMHRVVDMLREWDKLLEEYFNEFSGSWRYYAISNRMDTIKEFGGEDDDYNEDGTIKSNFTDEQLMNYTVVKELISDDWADIVFDSDVTDLDNLPNAVRIASQIHIEDIIKDVYGKELTLYKTNKDGTMTPMTTIEKALYKIDAEASGEELALILRGVICAMNIVCIVIKNRLNPTEDNIDQLQGLHGFVRSMLDLDERLIDKIREIHQNN